MSASNKIVVVIGDVTLDILIPPQEAPYADRSEPQLAALGGALFVARMLRSALKGKIGSSLVQVDSYEEAPARASQPYQAKWKIKLFHQRPNHVRKEEVPDDVFRCVETPRPTIPFERPACGEKPSELSFTHKTGCDLLVIEDLNPSQGPWARSRSPLHLDNQEVGVEQTSFLLRESEWKPLLDGLSASRRSGYCPRICAMINRHLPDFTNGLWRELVTNHKQWTIVVLYADILRWAGLNISKQVSWERTAQDYLTQLYTDTTLRELGEFQHLVVRFGVTGAIHSYRIGKKDPQRRIHRLYFDPTAGRYGIYRDATVDGDLIGNNSIYVASIVKELCEYMTAQSEEQGDKSCNEYAIAETIGDGIRKAIARSQRHFSAGYGSCLGDVRQFLAKGGFDASLFDQEADGSVAIADERIPLGNLSWNILNQSAEYRLLEVAHSIVTIGLARALNRADPVRGKPAVWAPVVRFESEDGKSGIALVDRREIESYRSVHNMLRAARHPARTRPLSIAVFGPPGSGKSYSIKVLAESAQYSLCDAVLVRNLAEHKSPEVIEEIKRWSVETQTNTLTPLVFLDEFDCVLEGMELGWLKYFLSMMESWESPNRVKKGGEVGGPPIFIFMGGTRFTYREFCGVAGGEKSQEMRFVGAKGPDFVSRLSGHIDIIGPNPTDEYDQAYVIRRALVLRRLLEDRVPIAFKGSQNGFNEWFQEEIIRAMLTVPSYKHGSRSMRAIVDMCVLFGGENGMYVQTSLPTVPQLDMHVDGKEFLSRAHVARAELERERGVSMVLPLR